MEKFIITTHEDLSGLIQEAVQKGIQNSLSQYQENTKLPELLNISQAAEYLNLAKQTLYGFTSNREIPFIKKGKKLYFRKSDLDKWLSEGRKSTKAEINAAITETLISTGDEKNISLKIKKLRRP
ncbi:MAG: helix-turn-helix domain-containing protein [Bacteroidota bacterium]|nr:helix-turn-helix domain-containing protein [Bacteroidota bacterium]